MKLRILAEEGTPTNHYDLFCYGELLEDGVGLDYYDIFQDCTLLLVLKVSTQRVISCGLERARPGEKGAPCLLEPI